MNEVKHMTKDELLKKAREKDVVSLCEIAGRYMGGEKGFRKDVGKALQIYAALAKNGVHGAMKSLLAYYCHPPETGDANEFIKWLGEYAKQKHPRAMVELGLIFCNEAPAYVCNIKGFSLLDFTNKFDEGISLIVNGISIAEEAEKKGEENPLDFRLYADSYYLFHHHYRNDNGYDPLVISGQRKSEKYGAVMLKTFYILKAIILAKEALRKKLIPPGYQEYIEILSSSADAAQKELIALSKVCEMENKLAKEIFTFLELPDIDEGLRNDLRNSLILMGKSWNFCTD